MEQIRVRTNQYYTECAIDVNNNFDSHYKKLFDIIMNNKIINFLDAKIKMAEENGDLNMFNKLKENPLMLFSECCADYCNLTRKNNNMRQKFEDYILDKINKNISKDNLVITFYGTGYLLQEMIILTKLKQLGYNISSINLCESRFGEYIDCMKNDSNIFNVTNNDTNTERSLWLSAYTLRIYHFMNYLNYIGINTKLNIFDKSINIIKSNTISNIFIGIDYIDDGFTDTSQFHYVAMSTTNGICASIISYGMIEIYKNKPNDDIAKYYYLRENKCDELKEKAEKEVTCDKIDDENKSEIKYDEHMLTRDGYYGVKYTENYKNIKKQMDELDIEYHKYINNIKKDVIYSGDFYKFILYNSINNGLKYIGLNKLINYF